MCWPTTQNNSPICLRPSMPLSRGCQVLPRDRGNSAADVCNGLLTLLTSCTGRAAHDQRAFLLLKPCCLPESSLDQQQAWCLSMAQCLFKSSTGQPTEQCRESASSELAPDLLVKAWLFYEVLQHAPTIYAQESIKRDAKPIPDKLC